ncbi:MAG: polyprenyl synthetase family protein, partial [Oscillospiraceae bacterium]|nr:polyprenyl synthetase family protein [Oscillospiraceae bacterium]
MAVPYWRISKMDERLKEYKDYIESFLQEWYARYHDAPQTRLFDSVEYSLMAGGKRLRPVLAFEFCRMCGADWKKATPFAAAIEMIHTYSLIHDDLPCMDDDDYRRG